MKSRITSCLFRILEKTLMALFFAISLFGCNRNDDIRENSLAGLRWGGGDAESRYVRDLLINAIHDSSSNLKKPNLVSVAFHDRAMMKLIVFHWIASPPGADGAILAMRSGATLQVHFDETDLADNLNKQKGDNAHATCMAIVHIQSEEIDINQILSGRLTLEGHPVSNDCSLRWQK